MSLRMDRRLFRVLYLSTQGLGLLCVLGVVLWLQIFRQGFGWRDQPNKEFNLHPVLMSFGFLYLNANSLLVYRGLRAVRKTYLKGLHIVIHLAVLTCVVVALLAAFDAHNATGKPNLYSAHSWLGLATVIVYLLQFLAGLVLYWLPGAPYTVRLKSISYHVFLGVALFVSSTCTAFSGFSEKLIFNLGQEYQQLPLEAVLVNLLALLHMVFCGLVVFLVTRTEFQRRPCPEDGVSVKAYPLHMAVNCSRSC